MAKGGKGGIQWVTVGGSKVPLVPSAKKGGKPTLGGTVGRKIRAEQAAKKSGGGGGIVAQAKARKDAAIAKSGSTAHLVKTNVNLKPTFKPFTLPGKSKARLSPDARAKAAARKARDSDLPTGQKSPAAKAGLARVIARRDAQDKQNAALKKAGSSARPPGIQRPGISGQNVPRGGGKLSKKAAQKVADDKGIAKIKAREKAARAAGTFGRKVSPPPTDSRGRLIKPKLSPGEKKSLKDIRVKGKAKTDAAGKAKESLSKVGSGGKDRAASLKAVKGGAGKPARVVGKLTAPEVKRSLLWQKKGMNPKQAAQMASLKGPQRREVVRSLKEGSSRVKSLANGEKFGLNAASARRQGIQVIQTTGKGAGKALPPAPKFGNKRGKGDVRGTTPEARRLNIKQRTKQTRTAGAQRREAAKKATIERREKAKSLPPGKRREFIRRLRLGESDVKLKKELG